jgi:hypothetical protein
MLYLFLRRARRARRAGGWTWRRAVVEAARTLLLFLLAVLLIAIFTRQEEAGVTHRVAVGPTFGWALFWSALTLSAGVALAAGVSRGPRAQKILAVVRQPLRFLLVVALAQFVVGTLLLVIDAASLDDPLTGGDAPFGYKIALFALAALYTPNLAINATAVSMGAPLSVPLGEGFGVGDASSVSLTDLSDVSAWYWLLPVFLGLLLVGVVVVMAVRQPAMAQAQQAVAVFAAAYAAGMLLLAIVNATPVLSVTDIGYVETSAGPTFGLALLWGFGAALIGLGVAVATPRGRHLAATAARPGAHRPGHPGPPGHTPPSAPPPPPAVPGPPAVQPPTPPGWPPAPPAGPAGPGGWPQPPPPAPAGWPPPTPPTGPAPPPPPPPPPTHPTPGSGEAPGPQPAAAPEAALDAEQTYVARDRYRPRPDVPPS